jgi:hypothetical protein
VGTFLNMEPSAATTDPATGSPQAGPHPRRRPLVVIGLAVAALALVAGAWHLVALRAYDTSAAPGPTASRLAAAELAARLEPWSARFEWRVIALRGLALFQQGKVDAAYNLLDAWVQTVFGRDATFISIYHEVLAVKIQVDSGKAHLAHGADPLLDFSVRPSATATAGQTPGSKEASPAE